MALYKGALRIKEQFNIIMDIFRLQKDDPVVAGTTKEFCWKLMGFAAVMLFMKFVFAIYLPTFIEIALMAIFVYLMTLALVSFAKKLNSATSRGLGSIVLVQLALLGVIILTSLTYYLF